MKPPAFQFYAADFLVGTATMTSEEVGAYIRLLCYQWDTGSVPDDDATIARLGGCQASAVAKVRQKFRKDEDGLRNERMEKERAKQRAFREKQAENGAKRWAGNAKPQAVAKPTNEPNACSPVSVSVSIENTNTPLPPKGGELPLLPSPDPGPPTQPPKRRRAVSVDDPLPELPPELDSPSMRDAWRRWLEARAAVRKPVHAPGARQCFADFKRWGIAASVESINKSIRCQYQGIFEPDSLKGQAPIGTPVEPIKPRIPDNLRDEIPE